MCTVTYLPLADNRFILTSNRDEGVMRKPALMPEVYEIAGKQAKRAELGLVRLLMGVSCV